jgi:hypothetical protein
MGKSALALILAGRWPSLVLYDKTGVQPLEALLARAYRQLSGKDHAAKTNVDDLILKVAARLDEQRCLWIIDGLHQMQATAAKNLVRLFGEALKAGRLVATSRERVELGSGDPDRVELRLEGLERNHAQSLWKQLDEFYGPAAGFEAAWKRSRGNPFLLRRAHAGAFDEPDPVSTVLDDLQLDERIVARTLLLAEGPVPADQLCALLPQDRAQRALRRLITRLVVDADGTGACALHPLFAEAVRTKLSEMVLDARKHELRILGRTISLQRRLVLRRLLYALAARPGCDFSKQELAERLWAVPYHPLQHDNALWVSIRRLRAMLALTGLVIGAGERGYTLIVPEGFVFTPARSGAGNNQLQVVPLTPTLSQRERG